MILDAMTFLWRHCNVERFWVNELIWNIRSSCTFVRASVGSGFHPLSGKKTHFKIGAFVFGEILSKCVDFGSVDPISTEIWPKLAEISGFRQWFGKRIYESTIDNVSTLLWGSSNIIRLCAKLAQFPPLDGSRKRTENGWNWWFSTVIWKPNFN